MIVVTCKCGTDYYKIDDEFIKFVNEPRFNAHYWEEGKALGKWAYKEFGTWFINHHNDSCQSYHCPTNKERLMFKCENCGHINKSNLDTYKCGCGLLYYRINHNQPYPDEGKYDEYWSGKTWATFRLDEWRGDWHGECAGCDRRLPE